MSRLKIAIYVIALVVAITVWAVELGGSPFVSLAAAPDLSGAISQSLVANSNGSLPKAGSDFQIKDTKYLENRTWAASKIQFSDKSGNDITAVVVLRQTKNSYQVVLGPGTAFSADSTKNLPGSVIKYLKDAGVVIYSLPGEQP